MRRTSGYVALAAALLVCSPAAAADLSPLRRGLPDAPELRPTIEWTGYYAGLQIGYAVGRDITREYLTNPFTFVGLENRFQSTGLVGGGHVGANVAFGHFVVGVEADLEYGKVRGSFVDPPEPPFNPGGMGRTELGLQGSLRARVGYSFGRMLIYGTAGLAAGQLHSTYYNWAGVGETFRRTIYGYTLGGGIEYALTPHVTMRGEYRFTDYRLSQNDSTVAFPGFSGTQDPTLSTFRLGVSYRY